MHTSLKNWWVVHTGKIRGRDVRLAIKALHELAGMDCGPPILLRLCESRLESGDGRARAWGECALELIFIKIGGFKKSLPRAPRVSRFIRSRHLNGSLAVDVVCSYPLGGIACHRCMFARARHVGAKKKLPGVDLKNYLVERDN